MKKINLWFVSVFMFFVLAGTVMNSVSIKLLREMIDSTSDLAIVLGENAIQLNARVDSLEAIIYKNTHVRLTAYSPRRQETDSTPFINAMQKRVRPGDIAVSRPLFEQGWTFGRKVYIYQHGVYTIADLMSPRIKDHAIDLYMPSTKQARKFGVKEGIMAVLIE